MSSVVGSNTATKMVNPLTVALVGGGRIAGTFASSNASPVTHAAAIRAMPNLSLQAIVEPDERRRGIFAERWQIPVQAAAIAELKNSYDIITVAVPDALHIMTVADVLNHAPPRLLLLEKPICTRESELPVLRELLDARPTCQFAVNHSRRFDLGHEKVRTLLAQKKLGNIIDVRWVYYGGWVHNGVHVVDTLRMLLDDDLIVRRVSNGTSGPHGDPSIEAEFSLCKSPNVRIRIDSFPENAFQLFEGEIRCQDGRIRILDFGNQIFIDKVKTNPINERELRETQALVVDEHAPPMLNFYTAAVRLLRENDNAIIERAGFNSAAETMRVLFEVRKAYDATGH